MRVREIQIGKDVYPVLFSYAAMADFSEARGVPFSEIPGAIISKDARLSDLMMMVYCGMFHGHRRATNKQGDFPLSYYEVCDLMDVNETALADIIKMFIDAVMKEREEGKEQPVTHPADQHKSQTSEMQP